MKKLNLGCGKVILEGYVNADLRQLPGVDVTFDAFIFPWPFQDGEFDEIITSHLVEHIPHLVRKRIDHKVGNTIDYNQWDLVPIWEENGFFVFFREVWRILKPKGLIFIEGPYARSLGADQDPTHTRALTEATFSYLWQWSDTFDYQLRYKFNQVSWEFLLNDPWNEMFRASVDLKESEPERAKQAEAELHWALRHYWNVAHSFRTVLQKVELGDKVAGEA